MRLPDIVIAARNFRYLPHVAIGVGVLICAAVAYYVFSGKTPVQQPVANSQGYSENSYCRVVSFSERAKNGTAGPCLRCITGTYTATAWTNCPVRQSSDQPGSVECGYNADQTPTAIDPAAMCAESGNGQATPAGAIAAPPPAGGAVPNSGSIASNGENRSAPTGINPNDISGPYVPNSGTASSPGSNSPPPSVAPNNPNTNSGLHPPGVVVVTRAPQPAPPAGANNSNIDNGAPIGGGYLGVRIARSGPARVVAVALGSTGAIAGIKPGDFIERIEGIPIDNGEDVLDILSRFHPRDHVQLEISRGEQTYSVNVVLGTRPASNAGGSASTGGVYTGSNAADLLQVLGQQEHRDALGNITQEAATIDILACKGSGRQFYVYAYRNRPGFRAIQPPDWSHPLGGRDFATFAEAVNASCGQ